MAIPSRERAEQILADRHLPDALVSHSRGVARAAVAAARLLVAAGIPVDVERVEMAGLLHDIDKLETREDGDRHGEVAAGWLTDMGYEELAGPVRAHPVARLVDADRFPRGWEQVVVQLADRDVAQGFMTIEERLDDMARRYPDARGMLDEARTPALALEAELADATGLSVDELRARLRTAVEQVGVEGGPA